MNNNLSFKEKQKNEAIKRMKLLSLHADVINEFITENKLFKSEQHGILYWLDEKEMEFVKAVEKEHNSVVYHIIKSYTEFGILLNIFYVSPQIFIYHRYTFAKTRWDFTCKFNRFC